MPLLKCFRKTILLTGLFLLILQGSIAQYVASSSIVVELTGIRNDRGNICLALFNAPSGFPENSDKAYKLLEMPATKDTASSVFTMIPSGTYAIGILHDENKNRKMDKNWLGMPREEYGASNNARPRFRAPSFKAASFLHGSDATTTIRIEVK